MCVSYVCYQTISFTLCSRYTSKGIEFDDDSFSEKYCYTLCGCRCTVQKFCVKICNCCIIKASCKDCR